MATTLEPSPSLPYARARLRLGITGVGSSVVLASVWLTLLISGVVELPRGWHPLATSRGPLLDAAIAALIAFGLHALLLFPTELNGGTRVLRQSRRVGDWFVAWMRGLLAQAALLALSAMVIAATAIAYRDHVFAPAAAAAALTLLLLGWQGSVARLMAALRLRSADTQLVRLAAASGVRAKRLRVVEARDESFVGGWVGLLRPELWIPARWAEPQRASLLAVQFARRAAQLRSGARRRGLVFTVAWNVAGMLLISWLMPWDFNEARTYLALPAASTLWSFVAVLLLPTPSRAAVYAADRDVAEAMGALPVAEAITQLDRWQDDEPERSPGVERIFHPVPSRGNRLRALDEPRRRRIGAHQLTRLVLYTTTATLSPLGRVVHCNIGRPSLWALYPGD